MSDLHKKMRTKVWEALLDAFLKMDGRGSWTSALNSCGCEMLGYGTLFDDNEDDLFIRDVAIGHIRVPRELALKILVLGEIPLHKTRSAP